MKSEVVTAAACKAVSLGCLLVTMGILARTLTRVEFGGYVIYLGTIQLAAVAAQLGLHQAIMRQLAECLERHEKTKAFIYEGLKRVLIVASIIIGIAGLVIWQIDIGTRSKIGNGYLVLGAVWAISAALQLAVADSFKAFRLSSLSFIYGETGTALLTLVLVIMFAMSGRTMTLGSILAISIFASVVFVILGTIHLLAHAKRQDSQANDAAGQGIDYTSGWRICLAYSLMIGMYPAILWFAGYYGGAEIAGQFALSHKLAALIVLPMLVTNSMMPRRIMGYKLSGTGQREIQKISFLATTVAILGMITVAAMGDFIVSFWLGTNHADIATMALWLQAGKLVTVIFGASNIILVIYNQERRFVESGFVAMTILVFSLYLPYEINIEYRIIIASICCAVVHAGYQFVHSRNAIGFFYPFPWDETESKTILPKNAIIIAGVPKAGTTTLHDALLGHKDLLMPKIKEPSFFNDDENYKRGISYYFKKYYPALAEDSILVDCSPLYAGSRHAASRIKQVFQDRVKVVLILRDPVDRAYSHYLHNKRDELYSGDVSFESALGLNTKKDGGSDCLFYSKYNEIVNIWVNEFGRDSILLLKFETDIAADLEAGVNKVCDFAGIERIRVSQIKSNPARQSKPGFSVLRKIFFSDSMMKQAVKQVIPPIYRHKFRLFFNDLTSTEIKDKKVIDDTSREYIYNRYFRKDMEALKKDFDIDYTIISKTTQSA